MGHEWAAILDAIFIEHKALSNVVVNKSFNQSLQLCSATKMARSDFALTQ